MSFIIIGSGIYVKIKHVAKTCKQLKKIWKNLLKKRVWKIKKKLLTRFKSSDKLSESLECDNKKQKKQKVTTKVVERKWSLKIEQNIYKYI